MAFDQLKGAMISASVLTLPNFSKQFVIECECDASRAGLGAVLVSDGKLIAFFSKGLAGTMVSRLAYEKELMALVLAVQH